VARYWPGFYLPNFKPVINDYATGRKIKLADNSTRKIVDILRQGMYLYVYVEGDILVPTSSAPPTNIRSSKSLMRIDCLLRIANLTRALNTPGP
jgi:hypothetical protein